MALIHSSYYRPRVYGLNNDITPAQIDRVQDLTASLTLNREKIREVGRDGIVDWIKRTPTSRVSIRQLEHGNIAFWRQLTNQPNKGADGQTAIDIANDFKTSAVDICGYKTDDDGNFTATVWYPKLRTAGWGLNIGDPQAIVERTFELAGEDEIILEDNNKYFLFKRFVASGGTPENFVVTDPRPSGDPDNSGKYLFRVVRVRSGVTTELTYAATGTDSYTFVADDDFEVNASIAGDIYKVYYSASSYDVGENIFTNNDTDVGALEADSATIELYTTTQVTRLQSIAIDVAYDRYDIYEIGTEDVVARGIRDKTVRITLGRVISTNSLEQALRGVGPTYGKLSPRLYADDITLKVKLYSSSAKTSFAIGYKFTNLSPTGLDAGTPLSDYITRGATLEGEEGIISTDSGLFTTGT